MISALHGNRDGAVLKVFTLHVPPGSCRAFTQHQLRKQIPVDYGEVDRDKRGGHIVYMTTKI
jgi:hypothetical protein